MGFVSHKNSYIRDYWNVLDFCVVCIGVIEMVPFLPAANLKALRTLRVLRPLRSINAVPSMRRLISSLLDSLPKLGNVLIFLLFVFILFGILGVQQFCGSFYFRCRYTEKPLPGATSWPIVPEIDRLCTNDSLGNFECPAGTYCGHPYDYGLSLESENISES